jgi:hypothetical protein
MPGLMVKQRVCGFFGHVWRKSYSAYIDGRHSHIKIECEKCGLKTQWIDIKDGDA